MNKRLVFLLSLVLFILALILLYIIFFNKKNNQEEIKLQNISFDKLDQFTSNKSFIKDIGENVAKGNEFDKALPVVKFQDLNPLFIKDYGFDIAKPFYADIQGAKYRDPQTKPYILNNKLLTSIDGQSYIIFVYKWLNQDKTSVNIPLIILESAFNNLTKDNQLNYTNKERPVFLSPVIEINDLEKCYKISVTGTKYCDFYFKNKEMYEKIKNEWVNTNNIPRSVENFPLLIRVSPVELK